MPEEHGEPLTTQRIPATRSGALTGTRDTPPPYPLTRPAAPGSERATRYAGAISLAAALGGTLLCAAGTRGPAAR
ncbi:hypothetical protein [Microbacterium lushaniae]|uniref:Uncharacterized protein n=1 Tax=Microbacterium lushaniae TaxID=2614639 RepID=A0A5J6L310_9MICO|nr:hypothetical protein [Microbacterium lushaniae]QEW02771.1 hypothetical protein F6J85_06410 [Microbacterium lushaniae]